MADWWSDHGELPEQRECRLAMCACLNADMIFCGVRDGLCYFEVYFTGDSDGPKAVLFLPTDGLTAEKIANHAAAAYEVTDPELEEWRCPNGHDSSIPPKLPELMFLACGHYPTPTSWNEFCITCGVRHEPFRIQWRSYRIAGPVRNPKHYCGYCGAKRIFITRPSPPAGT
jgi:hypothetical protein